MFQASIVQDLIDSYKLLQSPNVTVVQSSPATSDDLKSFHSSDFVDLIAKLDSAANLNDFEDELLEYGIGYDCPLLEQHYSFIKTVAGASLTAAKLLNDGVCDVAVNWCGGWHHAQRLVKKNCYMQTFSFKVDSLICSTQPPISGAKQKGFVTSTTSS